MAACPRVLLVNSADESCGVYQFGHQVYRCLKPSHYFMMFHGKYDNHRNLFESIYNSKITHIILNKHTATLNFIAPEVLQVVRNMGVKVMIMPHDETIQYDRKLIDHVLWLDPTWPVKPEDGESILGRPVMPVPGVEDRPKNTVFTVGYAGWLFRHKRVEMLLDIFKDIPCHFNIHFHPYERARDTDYERHIKELFGDRATFNNEFLSPSDLTMFLSRNTVNVFPYEDRKIVNLGISSIIDYALAARRPIMISDSVMFRNLHEIREQISIYRSNPIEVVMNYKQVLAPYWEAWSPEKMQEVVQKAL